MDSIKSLPPVSVSSPVSVSAKWWIAVGIVIILIAPVILTRPAIWSWADFSNSADIGETIGGITAPVVGILSAVLLFFALMQQVKTNELTQQQIAAQNKKDALRSESDAIHQLYNNLKQNIDSFSYSTLDAYDFGEGHYCYGSEAIYKLFQDLYCNCHTDEEELAGNPKITELTSILEICAAVLERLKTSEIEDKEVLTILTKHQFRYRIYPRLHTNISALQPHYCSSCAKNHGLPLSLVNLIQELKKRAIDEA